MSGVGMAQMEAGPAQTVQHPPQEAGYPRLMSGETGQPCRLHPGETEPLLTYLCSEARSIVGTPCKTPRYLLTYPSDGILVKIRVIFDFPDIYNVYVVCGNIFLFFCYFKTGKEGNRGGGGGGWGGGAEPQYLEGCHTFYWRGWGGGVLFFPMVPVYLQNLPPPPPPRPHPPPTL